MNDKPYYITTAISYPNGKPHIGHAYEAIATDAIARFHRLSGRDVRFLTGTDEHGLKMVQTAAKEGMDVKTLADKNSQYFKSMCDTFNISYDRFIRTTDADHKAKCQELWRAMSSNGDIYLDRYEGWYSVRDEAYYDESELTEDKLSPHGTPVEWTVEESYFFRLSKYQQPLLDYYVAHPNFIQPANRMNEIRKFVEGGLRDLSISRTSFSWGVPVPDDDKHVMYVWVDALANYLSGADGAWPADLHIIGKDIVRFHGVYWPAFLMSAGLELPKAVFGHGFLLSRGEKMSKSLGNVVDPIELAERFGVDAVRWYMLRKVSFGEDGGYSAEDIVQTYNADLANSFGNLVQRVFSFIAKNCEGRVPVRGIQLAADSQVVLDCGNPIFLYMASSAVEAPNLLADTGLWIDAVYAANRYVDETAPWALKKTDPVRMEAVLAVLLECIRSLAVAAQYFIPTSAAKVLAMFGKAAFNPTHIVIPAKAGIQRLGQVSSIETGAILDPGLRRDDGGEVGLAVSFDAINDHSWYDRWAASGFIIQPPTPIFPRLEMPVAD
jgi:methionyl-tRNA synthetase